MINIKSIATLNIIGKIVFEDSSQVSSNTSVTAENNLVNIEGTVISRNTMGVPYPLRTPRRDAKSSITPSFNISLFPVQTKSDSSSISAVYDIELEYETQ